MLRNLQELANFAKIPVPWKIRDRGELVGRGRNRPRPGYRQFLKRQFNKMAEEQKRKWAEVDKVKTEIQGKSFLDQDPEKIKVAPVVRYRHVCQCGHEFIGRNREASCRRCGSNMLTVTMGKEVGRHFEPIDS